MLPKSNTVGVLVTKLWLGLLALQRGLQVTECGSPTPLIH